MVSRELKIVADNRVPPEFVIEDKIPMPDKKAIGVPRYPFGRLKVGQSFTVPTERVQLARMAAAWWKRRHPGWDYASRFYRAEGIVRIWRTK